MKILNHHSYNDPYLNEQCLTLFLHLVRTKMEESGSLQGTIIKELISYLENEEKKLKFGD